MQTLTIKVKGPSDQLASIVNLVMRNPNVNIVALTKEDDSVANNNLMIRPRSPWERFRDDKRACFIGTGSRARLDIKATLAMLKLTEQELQDSAWELGSLEHSLKQSLSRR